MKEKRPANYTLALWWKWRVLNPTLGMPHLLLSWKLTFRICGAPNKAKWILERSVGKGLGWDFPRECLSLCSASCPVTRTVCPSQKGWRRGQKPSCPGTWDQGAWTWGICAICLEAAISPWEPQEQCSYVRSLGERAQHLWEENCQGLSVLCLVIYRTVFQIIKYSALGKCFSLQPVPGTPEPQCFCSRPADVALSTLPSNNKWPFSFKIFFSSFLSCSHYSPLPPTSFGLYVLISFLKVAAKKPGWLSGLERRTHSLVCG